MKYVAHVGVKLRDGVTTYDSYDWHYIKTVAGIEYRWCFHKNRTYEVIAGVFENKNEALICAKTMYVTLLYSLLKGGLTVENIGCDHYESRLYDEEHDNSREEYMEKENFFFWIPHYYGTQYGPGVYEVENSLDQFTEYQFFDCSMSVAYDSDLSFDNVDDYIFVYNRKAQELLHAVILADGEMNDGLKMTLYCGILEHLAEDGKKSDAAQCEIDNLIEEVDKSDLLGEEKEQLKNYLIGGKNISSRQKCKTLIKKYAAQQYGQYSAIKVFSDAYGIRSTFSHGGNDKSEKMKSLCYMKYLVLDVIEGYMKEQEC